MDYIIKHGEGNGSAGTFRVEAATDGLAIKYANGLVAGGLRNDAWASVELATGRYYVVRNKGGDYVGQLT